MSIPPQLWVFALKVALCIFTEHNLWLVLLAAAMCLSGMSISVRLWRKALAAQGRSLFDWTFLTAVTAGASIWATHFIAMLGYSAPAPVTFDGSLTIGSIIIAIAGMAVGIFLSAQKGFLLAEVTGGATIGLAVAAMHFVGMFAYRVDGMVQWDTFYILLAIGFSVIFSIAAVHLLRNPRRISSLGRDVFTVAAFVVAIVLLHFTAMTAFTVVPMPGVDVSWNSEAFNTMAMAVALAAMIILLTGFSSYAIDGRTRDRSERDLEYIATHDELTGVGNRRYFADILQRKKDRVDSAGESFALIMFDLDRFKPINDTLGHAVGDEVLKRVARRLEKLVGPNDVLARLGGDEFAIIMDSSASEGSRVETLCRRIIEMISRPFLVRGHIVEIGVSLGVAHASSRDPGELGIAQEADIALYAAKEAGRSTYRVFKPQMADKVQQRRSLEVDLRRAINREEFEVFYQAQVDASTGAITGAEALIRWNHPQRGLLAPDSFLPLAEDIGLISAIGTWILRKATSDAVSWPKHLNVAVNLSPTQILDRRLAKTVKAILEESGLEPSRLELEITETAIIGNDVLTHQVLRELRDLGVSIALDDFGTGYSSLSYLNRFPIDRIKIDKSFMERALNNPDSQSIVHAITSLGASLGKRITAEGIETDDQMAFAEGEGCTELQGYLFSRPIPNADFVALFSSSSKTKAA